MIDNEVPHSDKTKSLRKTKNSMPIKLDIPQPELMKPKITIFGVGGAGGNALNNMIRSNLEGVEFVAANTDSQALTHSLTPHRIQLGVKTTKGLGAGSFPDKGKIAAEENIEEIEKYLEGCNMVFIAAGMGGGTGTGAAPVIAKLAREREILTVGVVTKPFHFEGKYRMETAETGIEELKKHVDTLIIIPNQNLFRIANESTTFESAFKMADDVLYAGVRGVTDLITMPGLVNLDFADIRTIMTKMGKAMMGTGEASGENRAILACEAAIANPLLDDISIKGAKGVLVNMTGGPDMTLFEADIAVNTIRKEVDSNANIIFGSAFDENMKGKIRISVVATGIDSEEFRRDEENKAKEVNEPLRFRTLVPEISHHQNNKSFFDPGLSAKPQIDESEDFDMVNYNKQNSHIAKKHIESDDFDSEFESNDKKNLKHDASEFFGDSNFGTYEEDESSLASKTESDKLTKSSQRKNSHKASIYQDQDHDGSEIIVEKKPAKPTKTKAKSKKDSGGFSLFSFMNSAKDKDLEDDVEDKKDSKNIFSEISDFDESVTKDSEEANNYEKNHNPKKSHKNIDNDSSEDEVERKRKQFFGSTIFDEDEEKSSNQSNNFDDDIINVPAFFRRKK